MPSVDDGFRHHKKHNGNATPKPQQDKSIELLNKLAGNVMSAITTNNNYIAQVSGGGPGSIATALQLNTQLMTIFQDIQADIVADQKPAAAPAVAPAAPAVAPAAPAIAPAAPVVAPAAPAKPAVAPAAPVKA